MANADWREKSYNDTLDSVLALLSHRREIDPSFTVEDAKRTLQHFYIQQGNDWLGRGELQDGVLDAQIAAYEIFIHGWENEESRPG